MQSLENGLGTDGLEDFAIHKDAGEFADAEVIDDLCGLKHIDIAGIVAVLGKGELVIFGNRRSQALQIAVVDGIIRRFGR